MKVKLDGVMETLLITLDVRARDYKEQNSILKDKKSYEITQQIDYDFGKFQSEKKNYYGILARAKLMDAQIRKFIAKYPTCHIVSIGSGLDTRFDRIDNGKIHWYDVDFPDVIELRLKFFEPNERVKMIPKSLLDESWVKEVDTKGEKLLIISEGVLMYLSPEDVKKFLYILTDNFDSFEAQIDCISKALVNHAKSNKAVKHTDSEYLFGVKRGDEIVALNPKLKQIGYINFTDEMRKYMTGIFKIFIPVVYHYNNRLCIYSYDKNDIK